MQSSSSGGARLLRLRQFQSTEDMDVCKLRHRNSYFYRTYIRDLPSRRGSGQLRAPSGRCRGGSEDHQWRVAMEHRRLRILRIPGNQQPGRRHKLSKRLFTAAVNGLVN